MSRGLYDAVLLLYFNPYWTEIAAMILRGIEGWSCHPIRQTRR